MDTDRGFDIHYLMNTTCMRMILIILRRGWCCAAQGKGKDHKDEVVMVRVLPAIEGDEGTAKCRWVHLNNTILSPQHILFVKLFCRGDKITNCTCRLSASLLKSLHVPVGGWLQVISSNGVCATLIPSLNTFSPHILVLYMQSMAPESQPSRLHPSWWNYCFRRRRQVWNRMGREGKVDDKDNEANEYIWKQTLHSSRCRTTSIDTAHIAVHQCTASESHIIQKEEWSYKCSAATSMILVDVICFDNFVVYGSLFLFCFCLLSNGLIYYN